MEETELAGKRLPTGLLLFLFLKRLPAGLLLFLFLKRLPAGLLLFLFLKRIPVGLLLFLFLKRLPTGLLFLWVSEAFFFPGRPVSFFCSGFLGLSPKGGCFLFSVFWPLGLCTVSFSVFRSITLPWGFLFLPDDPTLARAGH